MQIFVMWLDLVTYLHHHGHEDKLPWYRGKVFLFFSCQGFRISCYTPKKIKIKITTTTTQNKTKIKNKQRNKLRIS